MCAMRRPRSCSLCRGKLDASLPGSPTSLRARNFSQIDLPLHSTARCSEVMVSATISYLPGMQAHARVHGLTFRNVDRAGFDPSMDCYLRDGGYEQLRKAVTMDRQAIIDEVK